MDHLEQVRRKLFSIIFVILLCENAIFVALWWFGNRQNQGPELALLIISLSALLVSCLVALLISRIATEPLKAIWQGIIHISPSEHGVGPPKITKLTVGRELVISLLGQIYQLNDIGQKAATEAEEEHKDLKHNFIAQNLPLPLFVIDAAENIKFVNQAASDYIGIEVENLLDKNIYMVLDMSFPNEETFDSWLKKVKTNKATAQEYWERIKLNVRDNHPERLFDLAAYYNRNNRDSLETMLVLFDHTKSYSQDEQAISFVALSVHELRTPLTLLRGYIEVFEDELGDKVDPELKDFMEKMSSQAEQLMSYVNNILNVARIDNDQLELRLQKADWKVVLTDAINSLKLQAKVRGIRLECAIEDDLPTVGIDRLSITEVVNNIIDNAIKYSGSSLTINIEAHKTKDGLVETTIKDYGLGISQSILPNLFTKFYRDHRNRAQIGGNGLGLYLSKAIITAHGGNLWVRSVEDKGSTFGFTLVPYDQLNQQAQADGNQDIVRGAHGWIKNHSLYRR
jgi:signal transduction histidine kinase